MSLRRNILANYVSQIYVTLVGILMLPLYMRYMGAEAYGLVGFFAMLQAWFNLLDMGLSPTVARETARFQGGAIDAANYRRLVRALEGVFLIVAVSGGTALFYSAEHIARHWLKTLSLPLSEVDRALQFIALIIALRWASGLYRGVISGSQSQVWLSGFNALIASLRFIAVVPLLAHVSSTPTLFFGFQLGVACVELGVLAFAAYRLLPRLQKTVVMASAWQPLKPVLKFSLSIAFTSAVWVLVTQIDKLILSKLLPLADYGLFSLAVLVASGIMLLSGPVSSAIMPRMAKLEAEGDQEGLIRTYRQATQLVAVLAGSVAGSIAFFSEPLLWVWTGDRNLAQQAAPVLTLYALGNAVLAVSAFPYYLQYAKGDLRMHLVGNALFVVFLVPLIIWAASRYGATGAGYAWLGMNVFTFVAWLPFVHRKFIPGLNILWYCKDVLPILAGIATTAYLLSHLVGEKQSRIYALFVLLICGCLIVCVAIALSSAARGLLAKHIAANRFVHYWR